MIKLDGKPNNNNNNNIPNNPTVSSSSPFLATEEPKVRGMSLKVSKSENFQHKDNLSVPNTPRSSLDVKTMPNEINTINKDLNLEKLNHDLNESTVINADNEMKNSNITLAYSSQISSTNSSRIHSPNKIKSEKYVVNKIK